MKKTFLTALTVAAVFFSSSAQAGVYLSGAFGYDNNKSNVKDAVTHTYTYNDMKNTPVYAFALGYELPIPAISVRAELEYLSMEIKSKDIYSVGLTDVVIKEKMRAGMANAYVRLPFLGIYGGAGAGYGYVKSEKTQMYQAMLGWEMTMPATPLSLALEYRRTQSGKDFKDDGVALKYKSDALMLKARFTF